MENNITTLAPPFPSFSFLLLFFTFLLIISYFFLFSSYFFHLLLFSQQPRIALF